MTPRVSRQPARDLSRGTITRWQWPRRMMGGLFRLATKRPSRTLAAMMLVSGVGAFAWNALMQQPNRHPHPLFAKADLPPEPPRRPEAPASPPLPVPRPETVGAVSPKKEETRVKPGSASDPIGALIRSGESAGPAPVEAKPNPRVATAQKALTKLGYGPIEPNGLLGNQTRTALEKFERDTKIPVTGSLSRRTSKQLAALSGYAIE